MQGYLLVVDDVEINRELTLHILMSLGFTVATAKNGQEALDMAISESFDLVLMDLNMPVMDGFMATQHIKQHKPNLPVIALTASTTDSIQAKLDAAGFDGYITKPFNEQELCKNITEWLANSSDELTDSKVTSELANTILDIDYGLTLFSGNEGVYIRLLDDFSAELSSRYLLLSQQIESLITQQKHLKQDGFFALHSETHALKGISSNLGLNGLAQAVTELDNLLRQGIEPSLDLLNNYQVQLNLAVKMITNFTEEYEVPAKKVINSTHIDQTSLLAEDLVSLDSLLSSVKDNEFIDEVNLAQLANKIPTNLINEWLAIANAIDQLDFSLAEEELTSLIAKIRQNYKLC